MSKPSLAYSMLAATVAASLLSGPALAAVTQPATPEITSVGGQTAVVMTPTSKVSGLSVAQVRQDLEENGNAPVNAVAGKDTLAPLVSNIEHGQLQAARPVDPNTANYQAASAPITTPVACVAITWDGRGNQPVSILVRAHQNGQWQDWENLAEEVLDGADGTTRGSEPWVLIGATRVQAVIVNPQGQQVTTARIQIIDPGVRAQDQAAALPQLDSAKTKTAKAEHGQLQADADTTAPATAEAGISGDSVEGTNNANVPDSVANTAKGLAWTAITPANVPQPVYTRQEWGADPELMHWSPRKGELKAAVIHHTAGANFYRPEQVPAILRSIYRYHASTLGWGDIGYNVLVDNFGRAWQGRSGDFWNTQIKGGHAFGVNETTFGISVLGDYNEFAPSQAALDTVARVIAYKLTWAGVDPDATTVLDGVEASGTVPTIIGHRDVPGKGGNTSCPGNAFYAKLPAERQLVRQYMTSGQATLTKAAVPQTKPAPAEEVLPRRLSGGDRVATSVAIASRFVGKPAAVYLARSDVYADALAAGSLPDGPVVLVNATHGAQNQVRGYINAAQPGKVVALGGQGAISDAVLKTVAAGRPTERLAGSSRALTSALIAQRAWGLNGKMSRVYLAEQSRGIDALSAGSLTDGPVILVPANGRVPASVAKTIATLNPRQVVALGGEKAVSSATLKSAAGGIATARLAGANRYGTSLQISNYQFSNARSYYLANAVNPIDAVAGGSLTEGPIVLVPPSGDLPAGVAQDIARLRPLGVTALGGAKAVADALLDQAIEQADQTRAQAKTATS